MSGDGDLAASAATICSTPLGETPTSTLFSWIMRLRMTGGQTANHAPRHQDHHGARRRLGEALQRAGRQQPTGFSTLARPRGTFATREVLDAAFTRVPSSTPEPVSRPTTADAWATARPDMLEHFKTAYRINDGAQTLADDEIGITA